MEHQNQLIRDVADRTARSLLSAEGTEVARLCRLLAVDARSRADAAKTAAVPQERAADEQEVRVGIWRLQKNGAKSSFVRSQEHIAEWREWANVARIEPKGTQRRVVLIGESVARGWFYEPKFTPATVLQSVLAEQLGTGSVEVIDLARTNLGFEVGELAQAALALEPDAVVLFCGNNWQAGLPRDPRDLACWTTALRNGGVEALRECSVNAVRTAAENVLRKITDEYRQQQVPLYWIVPEFNLGNWTDQRKNAPYLPGRANDEWLEWFDKAQAALAAEQFEEAIRCAQQLRKIDRGLSATGAAIVAECSQRLGDTATAREYLELARDAEMWDWMAVRSPRALSVTQELIRAQAREPGNYVIDLPRIFAEYLHGEIPDQRLFLDYCHLTSEGIRISMAAAASAVLSGLGGATVPWRDLFERAPQAKAPMEADARLLAAIHNAHWAQPHETIQRLCADAVNASEGIAQIMALVARVQSTRVPVLLSQMTDSLLQCDSEAAQHFIFRHSIQRYDRSLVDAIVALLSERDAGYERNIQELRLRDHSVARRRINLLEFYYGSSACQPEETGWEMPVQLFDRRFYRADYYRAYWRESVFVFVGDRDYPAYLRLVLRLPATGVVAVNLNNRQVWKGQVDRQWTTVGITLEPQFLQTGTNELRLLWPDPEPSGKEIGIVADRLEAGVMCPLLPVFGEIHIATVGMTGDESGVAAGLCAGRDGECQPV